MTPREFQKEFERSIGFLDIPTNKRIISDDINYYLNEAQTIFVNKILDGMKQSIKDSQRNLDKIRKILIRNIALVRDGSLPTDRVFIYDLPNDYYYLISDRSNVTHCGITYDYVQNRLYSSENIGDLLHDACAKPSYKSPISELHGSKLYVHRDFNLTFTINSVNIDYVKTFNQINVLDDVNGICDLDESVHKEIVQLAVNIFLESDPDPNRFRSITEKNILTEQIK
jgi:hypothetical protein